MKDSKISLLEKLTKLTGAMYLSYLKTMAYATIRTELHDIDPQKYTLFQWKDAAKYLTGNDVDLDIETLRGVSIFYNHYKRQRRSDKGYRFKRKATRYYYR